MSIMLLIMDSPSRRQSLPRGVGIDVSRTQNPTFAVYQRPLRLQIVLAGFSEANGQGGAQLEQLTGCYRNTAVLLKSWPGESTQSAAATKLAANMLYGLGQDSCNAASTTSAASNPSWMLFAYQFCR